MDDASGVAVVHRRDEMTEPDSSLPFFYLSHVAYLRQEVALRRVLHDDVDSLRRFDALPEKRRNENRLISNQSVSEFLRTS